MKNFIIAVTITLLGFINASAQNYNYQGYVNNRTGIDSVRASFYIAGEQFNPTTVFNSSNYPVWFKENEMVKIENGILNYMLINVDVDSLIVNRGQLYLYVTLNGTPFDKVLISAVPYSTYSQFATNSIYSIQADSAKYANNSRNSAHAVRADTAQYAFITDFADSSNSASVASLSISSITALIADSALTITDGAVTAEKLGQQSVGISHLNTINAASNQTVLSYINGNFIWASRDYVNTTTVQKTLTVPLGINDNTLYFISQVAQDYSVVEPTPRYGRIIRIVNASTANTITVNWNNLFGGVVFIGPRSSVEFMYVDTEWIKL